MGTINQPPIGLDAAELVPGSGTRGERTGFLPGDKHMELLLLIPACCGGQYVRPAWKADSSGFYFLTDKDSEFQYLAYYDVASENITKLYEESWDLEAPPARLGPVLPGW